MDSGTLFKARLDNNGLVSMLYEQVRSSLASLRSAVHGMHPGVAQGAHPSHSLRASLLAQEVRPKTKMGLSAQFDALNLEKAPKLGFAYNLKY